MNTLGYEVGTLGNHEFNYGLEFLDKALAGANFPFVSANLVKGELAADPLSDTTYIEPYRIVEKEITDGAGADIDDQDRLHRLPAAADHDLGRDPPRRQGQHPRHRRDRQGLRARR